MKEEGVKPRINMSWLKQQRYQQKMLCCTMQNLVCRSAHAYCLLLQSFVWISGCPDGLGLPWRKNRNLVSVARASWLESAAQQAYIQGFSRSANAYLAPTGSQAPGMWGERWGFLPSWVSREKNHEKCKQIREFQIQINYIGNKLD